MNYPQQAAGYLRTPLTKVGVVANGELCSLYLGSDFLHNS